MERLKVSNDKRSLETETGKHFFYLADTAWTLPQRLKWDDVIYYMKKRKSQGFNVLQIVALDPEMDIEMRNPAGVKALINNNLSQPNEAYFRYLDWVLDVAEEMEFYVVLLPVWGQLVVGENWNGEQFEKIVTEQNAYEFGRWIGNRYKDQTNLIWCLGGDRQPIHKGVDYRDVWRNMAEGLLKGVTGVSCKYNVANQAWRELVITYHTCYEVETGNYSTMSYWTEEEAWISFTMLQSGHGLHTQNYVEVQKEYERTHTLPVLDAEPAYEQMPMGWPITLPLHDEWIVRKRAYWSLFAGSCGHTYGHSSVWCMISDKEKNDILIYDWYEALERPGAYQMKILRDFFDSIPFERCIPNQSIMEHDQLCGKGCLDEHRQAAVDSRGQFAMVYFTNGGSEKIDLARLNGERFLALWFNPRDGKCYDSEHNLCDKVFEVHAEKGWTEFKAPTQGEKNDWILVIGSEENLFENIGKEVFRGEEMKIEQWPMIFV
ncbi:DUF4038 domain-containing protein [Paenibacillus periandrae]|uniref:apiosidase-like domain-containing protein n=1 Tax=Paenibacillus periandrae TaxID=1761741 RepID=UPI001F09EE05|nr:DUF4038 domain-containing protein [Paenibacillus periandrae]